MTLDEMMKAATDKITMDVAVLKKWADKLELFGGEIRRGCCPADIGNARLTMLDISREISNVISARGTVAEDV
jgi:hypothetical protein